MSNVLFKRLLVDEVVRFLDSRDVLVIYGARQVGKTSLLMYLVNNNLPQKNVFYFDLELQNLLDLCNLGPEKVYDYLMQRGAIKDEKIFLLIDEVQYLDDPSSFLKVFHDHYQNVKLIVSGSSTFEIKKKFNESLAGRVLPFELFTLGFEEFLVFKNKKYALLPINSDEVSAELVFLAEEYIRFGGYPKIVLEADEEKKKIYMFQLVNTYVRKDIRDIGKIRDIPGFNRLLEVLASGSGKLLNVSKVSSLLGLNIQTVQHYIDLLEKTFVLKIVRPFHRNLRAELSKNPKVYFLDTGLMHILWLKDFPKIVFGESFETFVFLELMKTGKSVHFWRTTAKQEVDFILSNGFLYAIEAKLNFANANRLHVSNFAKEYACKSFFVGLYGKKDGKFAWEMVKTIMDKK